MAIHYIDTSSFALATAVWLQSTLISKAPDGFYSFDGDYRQQSGGLLGANTSCSIPIPLEWSFNDFNGFGEMNLYVNEVAVVTRTVSDLGTYAVIVGDQIRVTVAAQGCASPNFKAIGVSAGLIAGDACSDGSVMYSSETYIVTSGDLGTSLLLDTFSQCEGLCLSPQLQENGL